jgi:RNA polymerase sigma-70 factor, ECF subfamily
VDRDLVLRAQQGDHRAFAEIASGSFGRLVAVARLILRDGNLAEDAVQEALVDAWRSLPTLRQPDRFDAWLRRLAVRACFDQARRSRRRGVVEVPLLPMDDVPTPDGAHALAARDEVERGLAHLSPEQRAVLVLTYYLDLPLAESAEVLGIPIGTLKSRLDRARSALRAALEAQDRLTGAITEQPA